ncbi:hypothetical protein TRFO_20284 [Tritrichomonas foetus]|uniref:Uncharacterized protein n=1 Tax=Tritrichomonas foetus TaxID=1144522 RepID=A0A1J4KH94_9EUKA|nr:hypothetical protein TRFO_20284 [Tritrichomonas foetus]|eukprot:OHT10410.1 hypothetical protein TRFO_20284 [Tritrichomonas foetus]
MNEKQESSQLSSADIISHGITISRLNESAQKIKQIEENQAIQLQNQLRLKDTEIARLKDELTKYKLSKEEKKNKLLELNNVILSSITKIHENQNFSQPGLQEIYDENAKLVKQLSNYINNGNENQKLQKIVENLETELFELTEKRAIMNGESSPSIFQRLVENKKLLKKQINEMENYIRNSFQFEKDDIKSKIKNLQKNTSALSAELRQLKSDLKNWETHSQKNSTEPLKILITFCEELENEASFKEVEVKKLRNENIKLKSECSKLKSDSQVIEKEIAYITRSISGM